jgi:hypothetical protein
MRGARMLAFLLVFIPFLAFALQEVRTTSVQETAVFVHGKRIQCKVCGADPCMFKVRNGKVIVAYCEEHRPKVKLRKEPERKK